LLGAGLLFVIGTNIQSGWLLVLSSLLLGAAVAGALLPARMVRGIQVERDAPAEAFCGQEVGVETDVENRARGPKLAVVIEDAYLAPTRVLVPSLRSGEKVRLVTRRIARRRGVYESSAVKVTSSAPLGVATARRSLEVPGRTLVFPEVFDVDRLPISSGLPAPERSARSEPRRGTGAEYLGIREYRAGDSMRHVHWASTARHGTVMVREFEQDLAEALTIVVDTLADAEPSTERGRTPLDACCSIAASVGLAATREGRRLRVVAGVAGELRSIEGVDATGLLTWLAELGRGGGMPLGALLQVLANERRGSGPLLVACPTWEANSADSLVPILGSRASGTGAVVVEIGGERGRASARTLGPSAVERLCARLTGAGVSVTRVGSEGDLAEALRASMRSVG
jgi:hypothetical protein